MAEELYVYDLREDGDSSLSLVPRCITFEQVQQHFFTTVDRRYGWDQAPAGEQVFKLAGVIIRTGPSFFSQVYNPDGSPRPGVLINAHYPNFEAEPEWTPQPPYESRAFGDFTNSAGTWGLPIGGLLLNLQAKSGPVTLWPFIGANDTPPRYADAIRNVGWYPATDHLAAHPVWKIVTKEGDSLPPPPPGGTHVLLYHQGVIIGHIPVVAGAPPTNFTGLAWTVEGERWLIGALPGEPSHGPRHLMRGGMQSL